MKLKLYETFVAVQGEGILMGTPSLFVRTHGCNLACVWCDTPHTSLEAHKHKPDVVEPIQLAEHCREQAVRHLVLTGGEPLLQAKGLLPFVQDLEDWHVTVETNGEVALTETVVDFLNYVNLLSTSPKLFVKDWTKTSDLMDACIDECQVKIVVQDFAEAAEAVERGRELVEYQPDTPLILQPEWSRGAAWAGELADWTCREAPMVRVMPQVHKFIGVR